MDFRWNWWHIEHVQEHGVDPSEAEFVVENATPPFPRRIEEEKWLAWGRGNGGRLLQVMFLVDEDGTLFVIHARPLTKVEKRRFRRRVER